MYEDEDDLALYSEITTNLWQGGTGQYETTYQGNKRLPAMNDPKQFDVVVSLNAYALPVGWLVKELRFGFADGPLDSRLIAEVEQVADWAYAEWKKNQRVLVRCEAGLNRSGLVNGLILMRDGMKAEEAILLIREKRNRFALNNAAFEKYLLERK
jgi:hypothetical protein